METFEHLKGYFGYDIGAIEVLEVFYYTFERLFMLYANDINASFWGPNHDYFEKYEVETVSKDAEIEDFIDKNGWK